MKTSLALCLGAATAVTADYRPIVGPDTEHLVKGKFYLRVMNTTPQGLANIKSTAGNALTGLVPTLNFGELTLSEGYDQYNWNSEDMKSKYPADYKVLTDIVKMSEVLFVSPDHRQGVYADFITNTPLDYVKDMNLKADDAKAMPAVNTNSNWGLQFLADKPLTGSGDYKGMGKNGEGIDVYIVGTGMDATQAQLKGRVDVLPTSLNATGTTGTSTAQALVVLETASKVDKIYDVRALGDGQTVSVNALYKAAGAIMENVAKTKKLSIVDFGAFVPHLGLAGTAESNLARFLGANSNGLVHPVVNTNIGGTGACSGFAAGHGSWPYLSVGGIYPNGQVVYKILENGVQSPWASLGPCNQAMLPAFNIKAGNSYLHGPPAATAFSTGLVANILSTYPHLSTLQVRNLLITGAVPMDNFWEKDTAFYPNTAQKVFNVEDSCRSVVTPSIPDSWCRGQQCNKAALDTLCELNAKPKAGRQCLSLVKHIPNSWCQATGCDKAYASLCAWKCTA